MPGRWSRSLRAHALPVMGEIPVDGDRHGCGHAGAWADVVADATDSEPGPATYRVRPGLRRGEGVEGWRESGAMARPPGAPAAIH